MSKNEDEDRKTKNANQANEECAVYQIKEIDFSTITAVTAGDLSEEDYVAYIIYCIEKAEEDFKNGKCMTLEEAEKEMEEYHESCAARRDKRKH